MRILKVAGIVLLLLVLLPFLAVQFFGDPIARRVVRSLNTNLQTEIVIGDYDLSLLRSFPRLSANLTNVSVEGSDGSLLLEAERLACLLDLRSLWGEIRISGILVENGKLQLYTDPDGNTNYQLAGYTSVGDQAVDAGGDAGTVEFRIEEALFRNVTLVYQNAQLQTDAMLSVQRATLSGDFGAQEYRLRTDADLEVTYVDQEGYRYADREEVSLEGSISIDHRTGRYTLSPLKILSGDLTVEATGTLSPTPDGLDAELQLGSSSGNLQDVLALVPPAYAGTLGELETRGELDLSASVTGSWTAASYPRIDGRLGFTDGRLSSPRMNVEARDLDLDASFAYLEGPRGGVQTFAIERLTGTFRGEAFDLGLRMEDLNDPRIDFRANGSLPLSALPAFLEEGTVGEGTGLIRLDSVRLSGRYADMIEPRRMGRVASSGSIVIEDGELLIGERPVRFESGEVTLSDNQFQVNELSVELERTEFTVNGRATNLIPVLFADSLNTRDAALDFTATISGEAFDVAEILALTGPTEDEIAEAEDVAAVDSLVRQSNERRARLTDLLDGTFEVDLSAWEWDKLHGEDFRGQFVFSPGQLEVRGMSQTMDGQVRVDATSYFAFTNRIEARVSAENVDAEEFFAQSDNFGQEVLTADNLEGRMNARLLLELHYDESGEIDYELLRARAGIEIVDGELHDFELLENFAFALKSGDLEQVRFTRLSNFIEVRDRTVYIPAMFIQSSAINLTLSGTHTFDQYLEYFVKVNAGQVIANKISRHDDRLEVLPARNGLFNLYYTIRGPLESYEVETDKRAVKDDFRRSEYRRERIREELEERFRAPIALLPPVDDEDVDP